MSVTPIDVTAAAIREIVDGRTKVSADFTRAALRFVGAGLAVDGNESGARACEVLASVPSDVDLALLGRLLR